MNDEPIVQFDWSALADDDPAATLAAELADKFCLDAAQSKAIACHIMPKCESENRKKMAAFLRYFLETISSAYDPMREARCWRFACGFRRTNSESMRDVAVRSGVTVEAVSARVTEIRRALGLPVNDFNKVESAGGVYRLTNAKRRKSE
jgi:hypothetical protein